MTTNYMMASTDSDTIARSAMLTALSMRGSMKATRKMTGETLRNELREIEISKKHIIQCAKTLAQRGAA